MKSKLKFSIKKRKMPEDLISQSTPLITAILSTEGKNNE